MEETTPALAGAGLEAALDRLVADGTLSREQAAAVRRELAAPSGEPGPARAWTAVLAEVGGYVGAAFVAGAAIVLTGPHWASLDRPARLALLLVPAVLLVGAAVAISRSSGHRRAAGPRGRLVAALVLVAGGLAAAAGAEVASWRYDGVVASVIALAVWGTGYLLGRSALLELATAGGLAWLTLATASTAQNGAGWGGVALVLVGGVWAWLAVSGRLVDAGAGVASAGILAFVGAEVAVVDSYQIGSKPFGYLALVAVTVAGLAGYVLVRLVVALVIGTVALATVVPQFVLDVTDGALGAGGGLLITGLSIVGASALGLRLHREVPGGAAPAGH